MKKIFLLFALISLVSNSFEIGAFSPSHTQDSIDSHSSHSTSIGLDKYSSKDELPSDSHGMVPCDSHCLNHHCHCYFSQVYTNALLPLNTSTDIPDRRESYPDRHLGSLFRPPIS